MSSPALNPSPRVLLVAEHASAAFGGEALIPFQYFKNLREMDVDVHLVVHARTQQELCRSFPLDLERLHFVKDSLVNIWCHRIGQLMPNRLAVFTVSALSHLDTQLRQRRLVRRLLRAQGFDVVHEPIPVSPKQPSSMFGLPVPVVIGPMNGGMDYPPHYNPAGRLERIFMSCLRQSATFFNAVIPGKRHASLLLVANKRTRDALPSNLKNKPIVELPENGVDLALFAQRQMPAKDGVFRIIYVGRLVDWKRVDLLVDACARLADRVNFRLDLVGDGPLRDAIAAQVRRLNLSHRVLFHGRLMHRDIAALLAGSDVMVLPSMYECGGAVVLEAMASGLPVIATKWGGPTDYVTEDTGVLVPPDEPETFVGRLADAIAGLAGSAQTRQAMGKAGRRRVAALYDWRVKAQALVQIYATVLRTRQAEKKV